MINGEMLEKAERALIAAREIVPEDRVLFRRADIEQTGAENFLRHHLSTLILHSPSLDPTLEPAILTMFRHFLLIGAVAGRMNVNQE